MGLVVSLVLRGCIRVEYTVADGTVVDPQDVDRIESSEMSMMQALRDPGLEIVEPRPVVFQERNGNVV